MAGRGLRSFTYQAMGQLAARAPALFAKDVGIAARFFEALVSEPPGVRAAVQEALGALASAYRGCTGAALGCCPFTACWSHDMQTNQNHLIRPHG